MSKVITTRIKTYIGCTVTQILLSLQGTGCIARPHPMGKGRKVASSSRTRILCSTSPMKRRRPYRHDRTGTWRTASSRNSLHSCSCLPTAGPGTSSCLRRIEQRKDWNDDRRREQSQHAAVLAATERMRQFGQNAPSCWCAGVFRSGWCTGAPSDFQTHAKHMHTRAPASQGGHGMSLWG